LNGSRIAIALFSRYRVVSNLSTKTPETRISLTELDSNVWRIGTVRHRDSGFTVYSRRGDIAVHASLSTIHDIIAFGPELLLRW
jgi:hypothetical protein